MAQSLNSHSYIKRNPEALRDLADGGAGERDFFVGEMLDEDVGVGTHFEHAGQDDVVVHGAGAEQDFVNMDDVAVLDIAVFGMQDHGVFAQLVKEVIEDARSVMHIGDGAGEVDRVHAELQRR